MINKIVVSVDGESHNGIWAPVIHHIVEGEFEWMDSVVKIIHINTDNKIEPITVLARTSLHKTFDVLRDVVSEFITENNCTVDFGFDSSFTEYATWHIASDSTLL